MIEKDLFKACYKLVSALMVFLKGRVLFLRPQMDLKFTISEFGKSPSLI